MQIKKTRKVQSKLHPSDYVNKETGELMSSEVNEEISITLKQKTNQFVINSEEYVVFDSGAVMYLTQHLNKADIGKVFQMSDMVKTDCSILCQRNNFPHTPETLCTVLDMNLNKFYEFIRKLVKKNILAYAVCSPAGYVQKIYMLNPYIARKRKTINCELSNFFRDVTKDGQVTD